MLFHTHCYHCFTPIKNPAECFICRVVLCYSVVRLFLLPGGFYKFSCLFADFTPFFLLLRCQNFMMTAGNKHRKFNAIIYTPIWKSCARFKFFFFIGFHCTPPRLLHIPYLQHVHLSSRENSFFCFKELSIS